MNKCKEIKEKIDLFKRQRAALDARRQPIKMSDPELYMYYSDVIIGFDKLLNLLSKRLAKQTIEESKEFLKDEY
jgi:hypothetical protein